MTAIRTLCLAAALAIPAISEASTWNTRYVSADGRTIQAIVTINGSSGSYQSYDQFGNFVGAGSLFNLQYEPFGNTALLRGNWAWNAGGSGTLVWTLNPQITSFQGNWSFQGDPLARSWSGFRTGGGGALGGNGPVIP